MAPSSCRLDFKGTQTAVGGFGEAKARRSFSLDFKGPPTTVGCGESETHRIVVNIAAPPLAEHIDRLEFNSIDRVAIAAAYWRRKSPGRKRGRPGGTTAPCHGRPYEGWRMSKVQPPNYRWGDYRWLVRFGLTGAGQRETTQSRR